MGGYRPWRESCCSCDVFERRGSGCSYRNSREVVAQAIGWARNTICVDGSFVAEALAMLRTLIKEVPIENASGKDCLAHVFWLWVASYCE
jgi:hypothetical protein